MTYEDHTRPPVKTESGTTYFFRKYKPQTTWEHTDDDFDEVELARTQAWLGRSLADETDQWLQKGADQQGEHS